MTGSPQIRFAGAPIYSEGGAAPGTLCVFDQQPRHLNDKQRTALRALARQASRLIAVTARRAELSRWTALVESTLEATTDAICCVDRPRLSAPAEGSRRVRAYLGPVRVTRLRFSVCSHTR